MSFARSMIPAPIRRALGISSPSKVTAQLGRFVGLGLASGLEATTSIVRQAAGSLATAATPNLAGQAGWAAPAGVAAAGRTAGGGSAVDYDRLAGSLVRAMRQEGVGAAYLDGQLVTDNVSRRMGRSTDQRRRTG
jgi:hypothetical protein